ncbi:MAG: type II toxin-antitoxin system VapC family toxin [Chloroflexi bacterium]|nr:type II toxin-antitoxin system VapC family toxin [Chloroflexota bacterium]
MADKVFVDSNVLLRFTFSTLDHHEDCRIHLRRLISQRVELSISGQVIREFCVQASHPNTFVTTEMNPLSGAQLARWVASFHARFRVLEETAAVHQEFQYLLQHYPIGGRQMHDANIVATMLAHSVDALVTLNRVDFLRYQDRIAVVPPQADPA